MNLHEVSVVPCHPSDKKTSTFSIKDLRKNTFTICNVRRQKPRDPTNVGKSFYKRTTLTGVLQRRIRKRRELFLLMRLPKQLGQIFQLVDEFHSDTSYPVGVAVMICLMEWE